MENLIVKEDMELIKVTQQNGEQLVSARELHKKLEITERFNSWFGRMLKYGFIENVDFTGCKVFNTLANQELDEYILKLDMAKQICMLQRNELGTKFRLYFIECEKKLKEVSINPKQNLLLSIIQSPTEVERAVALNKYELEYVKPLELKIEQDKPLVEFANQVSNNSDLILVREFAKLLADENIKIGEKRLYQWFRENGYILKGKTEPTQRAIEQGLFKVIERVVKTPYGERLTSTTKISGKGQIYFTEKLRKLF